MNQVTVDLYADCGELVKSLMQHDRLYFTKPVELKIPGHDMTYGIYGICVSPKGRLYFMDDYESWLELEGCYTADRMLLKLLYRRLIMLKTMQDMGLCMN